MKRRSSTSAPPEPVFFCDRDLGRYVLPGILAAAGFSVECHDDHFAANTTDEEWLRQVGARGWIAITRDARIRYRMHEQSALMEARLRTFVLVGKAPQEKLAENFVHCRAKIIRFLNRHQHPFIAKVRRSRPHVEMWLSFEDWRNRPR